MERFNASLLLLGMPTRTAVGMAPGMNRTKDLPNTGCPRDWPLLNRQHEIRRTWNATVFWILCEHITLLLTRQ